MCCRVGSKYGFDALTRPPSCDHVWVGYMRSQRYTPATIYQYVSPSVRRMDNIHLCHTTRTLQRLYRQITPIINHLCPNTILLHCWNSICPLRQLQQSSLVPSNFVSVSLPCGSSTDFASYIVSLVLPRKSTASYHLQVYLSTVDDIQYD